MQSSIQREFLGWAVIYRNINKGTDLYLICQHVNDEPRRGSLEEATLFTEDTGRLYAHTYPMISVFYSTADTVPVYGITQRIIDEVPQYATAN